MHNSRWVKLKTFLIALTAILSVINGLLYLIFPGLSLRILGVHPDAFGLHMTRYYGACALGYGVLLWCLRKDETKRGAQGLLFSIFMLLGISVIIGAIGLVNGVTNRVSLSIVLLDLILCIGALALLIILFKEQP